MFASKLQKIFRPLPLIYYLVVKKVDSSFSMSLKIITPPPFFIVKNIMPSTYKPVRIWNEFSQVSVFFFIIISAPTKPSLPAWTSLTHEHSTNAHIHAHGHIKMKTIKQTNKHMRERWPTQFLKHFEGKDVYTFAWQKVARGIPSITFNPYLCVKWRTIYHFHPYQWYFTKLS